MLSQTTSCKSRDRSGAGVSAALVVCPDDLSGQVESLGYTEFGVALAVSGLPLHRGMSHREIVLAATSGVLAVGLDDVRTRAVRVLNLAGALDRTITDQQFETAHRRLVGSWRRWCVATALAFRYVDREANAALRQRLHGTAVRAVA